MNYSDIISEGFEDQNNREFLENYFVREFRKAEKDHYTAVEFFTGCIREIKAVETWINNVVASKKHKLFLLLGSAKDGTLQHTDLKGKTIEQANQETIEYCENALQNETPGSFAGQTFAASLSNGCMLDYNEAKYIEKSLLKAWQIVDPDYFKPTEPKGNKIIPGTEPKKDLSLRQIALLHVYKNILITEENCNSIANKYGWKAGQKLLEHYGFYRKTSNRIAEPETSKKLKIKINLFKSVFDLLPDDLKKLAEKDLKTLESKEIDTY